MIWSRDLVFVHVPKTGGMSLGGYLLERLPGPVYCTAAQQDATLPVHVIQLPGLRHERLAQARVVLAAHDVEILELPLILAMVRNPYEMEVSRYAYLQAGKAFDQGPAQRLALGHDFETFARRSPYYGRRQPAIEEYFLLDGRLPPQLRILRTEHLQADLSEALAGIGLEAGGQIPWQNRSSHDDWRLYYTPAAERAVFERYRWIFERGFYPRLDALAEVEERHEQRTHHLPLRGFARQVGPSTGLSEGWVLPRLDFQVRPTRDVGRVVITGWRPPEWGSLPLTLSLDGDPGVTGEMTGSWFRWAVDVGLAADQRVQLTLRSAAAVRPAARGESADERDLVFRLQHIDFLAAHQVQEVSG